MYPPYKRQTNHDTKLFLSLASKINGGIIFTDVSKISGLLVAMLF